MSFVDRTVLAIAPQAGLKRIKAKKAAAALMNYDGATKGRRSFGWKAPATDADSASGSGRATLRQLSRDMIRNRPFAARGQRTVTGNVVATGITPSVTMADDNADKEAAKSALTFLKSHLMTPDIDVYGVCGMAGLQTQVMDTVFSDGEVLVRRRVRSRRFHPDLPLPFQIQLMEADHLDETVTSNGENEVVDGIEYGPTGAIVAYHLFDRHPGDQRWWTRRKLVSSRVPAGDIIHVRRLSRPGQLRGVPWLAPVMLTLGELSDYQEAQILKQRIASLLAFFVTAGPDDTPYDGKALDQVAPGAIVGLERGQEVVPSTPPSVSGYSDFMRQGLSAVAMGLGITYESLAGDLRGVNFSSGRMGRMEMDRNVQIWQQQLLIDQFCRGVSKWALDFWKLERSNSRPEAPVAIEWTAPRRPLIDPAKEINAAKAEVDAGFTSRQRKQREMGHDPEVIATERAEDAQRDSAPASTTGDESNA